MVKQCAWCLRVEDEKGNAQGEPLPLIREATHGICSDCYAKEKAKLEADDARAA